jgi:hypothetical protein
MARSELWPIEINRLLGCEESLALMSSIDRSERIELLRLGQNPIAYLRNSKVLPLTEQGYRGRIPVLHSLIALAATVANWY